MKHITLTGQLAIPPPPGTAQLLIFPNPTRRPLNHSF
jgi:hypothetical protein